MEENRKEFLICVDSDGCAIDTMDIKHRYCFGPLFVEEWGLKHWEEELLERWNQINLYSETRGINRFKGLFQILKEVHETKQCIAGLQVFQQWVENARELSQAALGAYAASVRKEEADCLWKAISWSRKVNDAVERIPKREKKAFQGVREALEKASEQADIVVVSSANRQAVVEEWRQNGLMPYVKTFFAQDAGTKSHCIRELKKQGYSIGKILFVGDAIGDLDAAKENHVFFYPIIVGQEVASWKEFDRGVQLLMRQTYGGTYQESQTQRFLENFRILDRSNEVLNNRERC